MRLGRYFFIGIFILLGFTAFSFTSYDYQFKSFAQTNPSNNVPELPEQETILTDTETSPADTSTDETTTASTADTNDKEIPDTIAFELLDLLFIPISSVTDGLEFDRLDGAKGITTVKIDSKTYALVASFSDNGVQIMDITDPANVIAVSSVKDNRAGPFAELNGARSITTVKIGTSHYALVASSSDDGVQIMDITDPANVTPVSSVTNGDNFILEGASDITTVKIGSSTFALVASSQALGSSSADRGGIQIMDITDPANIISVSSVNNGDEGFDVLHRTTDITTVKIDSKTYALATSSLAHGVQIMDITDPANIISVNSITDGNDGFDMLNGARGITTVKIGTSHYALVASSSDNGVQIMDITDPANVTAVSSVTDGEEFDMLDGANGITTTTIGTSTLALVASYRDNGIQIMNITNPANITPLFIL